MPTSITISNPLAKPSMREVFFAPLDSEEVLDIAAIEEIDPTDIQLVFSDPGLDGVLRDLVEEMANDFNDRAHPAHRVCEVADIGSFTVGLVSLDAPDRLISMATVGYHAEGEAMCIVVDMLFTDAEFRGEGFGKVIAGACCAMTDRVLQNWEAMPGSSGRAPTSAVVVGDPVSDGGLALMEEIREDASFRIEDMARELSPAL